MKLLLTKIVVFCLAAIVCGGVAGVLFSLYYYSFIPDWRLADVLNSDTHAKVALRFWAAFGVGAVVGVAWAYGVVKTIKFLTDKPKDTEANRGHLKAQSRGT